MILNKNNLPKIAPGFNLNTFELPERIIQFGTGVLLRGLPDYFVNKANKRGIFNGRIVVVKSTAKGDISSFVKQDGLYTVCVRGIQNGKIVEQNIINSSISRVLNANDQWKDILLCAADPNIKIIISNTTEAGIKFEVDNIKHTPPVTFPGKLLSFLYQRYLIFNGSTDSGMIIIPTELILDNAAVLKCIVLKLAELNNLENQFINWLENHNHFCNSLVDRIVPGKPEGAEFQKLQKNLGYEDDLLIVTEVYKLWAIQGDENIKQQLSFKLADENIVIEENIDLYRELKLRILNGSHILTSGPAFLSGLKTVREAMDSKEMNLFISQLIMSEIVPSIPYAISYSIASNYAKNVLERFSNPQIKHPWINITAHYSHKVKLRCVPMIIKYYQKNTKAPELFSFGFAAYIFFMKSIKKDNDTYYGMYIGIDYEINDERAGIFYDLWQTLQIPEIVSAVLNDKIFWGHDLSSLPGFMDKVILYLNVILKDGMMQSVKLVNSVR